jgi:hypothetical protein
MGQRRPTKKEIVDAIIAEATFGRFKGDKRDGETPPITIQNFTDEGFRHAAKALRTRLSRLSLSELLAEAFAAVDHVEAKQDQLSHIVEFAERSEREEAARALRRRQAERGRKSRLQPTILAAAGRYRGHTSAKEAWDLIKKNPFMADDGSTVMIEGGELRRLQRMRVTVVAKPG